MSTPLVRTVLIDWITSLVAVPVLYLSEWNSRNDLPDGVDQCVLLQFIASSDRVMTLGGNGNQGFREEGTVGIHWLMPAGFDIDPVLEAAEDLRIALRGKTLSGVHIEEIEPFADEGSPIDEDGRWAGFSALLAYEYSSFEQE